MVDEAVASAGYLPELPAIAQSGQQKPLPIEELRAFTEVFGKIKSDYVEPVSDEKLIKEAINGMVHGLDPHSDFLDAEAFKDLQISTQGKFGGLGIEITVRARVPALGIGGPAVELEVTGHAVEEMP